MDERAGKAGRPAKPGPEVVKVTMLAPLGTAHRLKEQLVEGFRERGLTFDGVAEQMGIPTTTLQRLLLAEEIDLGTLRRLSEIAQVDPADLLALDDGNLDNLARMFKALCYFASTDSAELLERTPGD